MAQNRKTLNLMEGGLCPTSPTSQSTKKREVKGPFNLVAVGDSLKKGKVHPTKRRKEKFSLAIQIPTSTSMDDPNKERGPIEESVAKQKFRGSCLPAIQSLVDSLHSNRLAIYAPEALSLTSVELFYLFLVVFGHFIKTLSFHSLLSSSWWTSLTCLT